MIGLDSNVIVRYLAQDDPVQSAKATELLERESQRRETWFRKHRGDGRDCMGP